MSVSAWGLLLDLIGVAAVGWAEWATPHVGKLPGQDAFGIDSGAGNRTARKWIRRTGWILLIAGFALQLGGELM